MTVASIEKGTMHGSTNNTRGPDYGAVIRRRAAYFLIPFALIFVLATATAFLLPAVYRATATILIEQQEIPEELIRSTITSFADQRLQLISQRVMTRSNLTSIMERFELYQEEREKLPLETVIGLMRDAITVEAISSELADPRRGPQAGATIAFSVAYENESARLSQVVTNELVTLYLNENATSRAQIATETTTFLATESARLGEQVARLETRLAAFKEENIGRLPEDMELNLRLLERAEDDLKDANREIAALEERLIFLQSEMAKTDPTAMVVGPDGRPVPSPEQRLRALRSDYVTATAVYSPQHPDVIKLGKEIAALEQVVSPAVATAGLLQSLEQTRADLEVARERYADAHPDVRRLTREVAAIEAQLAETNDRPRAQSAPQADNPAYIQLRAQYEADQANLRASREARSQTRDKLEDLETRLAKSAEVEREYRALTREYEDAVGRFREINAKAMEAQLAEAVEKGRKGERFVLIEPPPLPQEPVRPNRIAIFVLGMVLAFGGGVGSMAVAEAMDRRIHGARSVADLLGEAPLAAIPFVQSGSDRKRRLTWKVGAAIVLLAGLAGALVALHTLWMPLDVAWFNVQQRLTAAWSALAF